MFANLTEAVKRRFILELKQFWSLDPNYKDTLVPHIQGKFSFRERPQQAIILKGVSANPQSLSADNFQGHVVSYCCLTRVTDAPGTSVEWVREDGRAIQRNGGVFPSAPGVYYLEFRKELFGELNPTESLVFYVDPLLEIIDEQPLKLDPRLYEVASGSFHPGSLRVYEMPGNLVLYSGVNYTADSETGQITLTAPMPPHTFLSVDYRHAGESVGPLLAPANTSNFEAIPGVVLAFGRRVQEGDVMAVVVNRYRETTALEYGGKWEMNVEFDIMSRDVNSTSEIADRTLMYLYTDVRSRMSSEGMEISTVSHSGEAEEQYDETADDYYYTASLSATVMTDWSIQTPLTWEVTRILPNTVESEMSVAGLDNDQLAEAGSPTSLKMYESLNLLFIRDPWFKDKAVTFETIR